MTLVLGIESSCDETAAAIVHDGRELVAEVVASQVELHRRYGGVFPEMASRQHILAITPVIRQTLAQAAMTWDDLDAIAAVYGPGLGGSLLVGLNAAKALAFARHLPLVGVNHLEGHIYANWLIPPAQDAASYVSPAFPLICLVVSGGHTDLVLMRDHHDYVRLGGTVDDAAGEAFDKVARLLGLGYPGGPAIQAAAEKGNPEAFHLPRALRVGPHDFSFSGLKTAVLRLVQDLKRQNGQHVEQDQKLVHSAVDGHDSALPIADIAASFQAAVVDSLVSKTEAAVLEFGAVEVLVAGGVAANKLLRSEIVRRLDKPVRFPPFRYCTDNAAMVAVAGHYRFLGGLQSTLDLDVVPSLRLV
jgi:N6-L-threonylcarbamoyladenine synthase